MNEEREEKEMEEENKDEEEEEKKSKRRKRLQLQCSLPHQCRRVVLVGKRNRFFLGTWRGRRRKRMRRRRGGGSKGGGRRGGRGGDYSSNAVYIYSTAMQLGFTHGQCNCFFPVNKVEERGKEEEDNKQQEEEDAIRTIMQSSVTMQQNCTRGSRQLFISSKQ